MSHPLEEASAFLKNLLATGPKTVFEVQRLAEESGIGWRTLRRASDAMQICKRPNADDKRWYWSLPDDTPDSLSNLSNVPAQEPRKRAAGRAPKPADVLREWQAYLLARQLEFPAKVAGAGKGWPRHSQGNATTVPRHDQTGALRGDVVEKEKSNADTAT